MGGFGRIGRRGLRPTGAVSHSFLRRKRRTVFVRGWKMDEAWQARLVPLVEETAGMLDEPILERLPIRDKGGVKFALQGGFDFDDDAS